MRWVSVIGIVCLQAHAARAIACRKFGSQARPGGRKLCAWVHRQLGGCRWLGVARAVHCLKTSAWVRASIRQMTASRQAPPPLLY